MTHTVLTPWPPQRNGIADYSFELARQAQDALTIVTEAMDPISCGRRVRVMHPTEVSPAGMRAVPCLYHFGNNPDHAVLLPLFLRYPGVAMVHDPSLHYLAEIVDMGLPGFFEAQMEAAHGGLAESMREIWAEPGLKRAFDYQQVAQLNWLREARAIIVHTRYAARLVGGFLPNTPIHVLPHFAYQPTIDTDAEGQALRNRLGISLDSIVIALTGFATRNKQYNAVFRAVGSLPAALKQRVVVLVAGELPPDNSDLPAVAAAMGCDGNVRFLGYTDEATLTATMACSDLLLNLRYPSFGESSGSVARALGMGCLVAVSDVAGYAEIPDDVCIKIRSQIDPSRDIVGLIRRLDDDPGFAAPIRAAAALLARTVLHPARLASQFAEIVEVLHA